MKKWQRTLSILLAVWAVLMAVSLYMGHRRRAEDTPDPQTRSAPDFKVYDMAGNEVRLSDFRGKPVVVNFWASWCGPCRMEMPDFEEKYQTYGDRVQFLMINLTDGATETTESATAFIADSGFTFPVYYDTDSVAASTYGVSSIPVTYFIDAQGNLVAKATGAIDGEAIQQGLDLIL